MKRRIWGIKFTVTAVNSSVTTLSFQKRFEGKEESRAKSADSSHDERKIIAIFVYQDEGIYRTLGAERKHKL